MSVSAPAGPATPVTGTVAVCAYAVGSIPDSIWEGVNWTTTLEYIFDGVV